MYIEINRNKRRRTQKRVKNKMTKIEKENLRKNGKKPSKLAKK